MGWGQVDARGNFLERDWLGPALAALSQAGVRGVATDIWVRPQLPSPCPTSLPPPLSSSFPRRFRCFCPSTAGCGSSSTCSPCCCLCCSARASAFVVCARSPCCFSPCERTMLLSSFSLLFLCGRFLRTPLRLVIAPPHHCIQSQLPSATAFPPSRPPSLPPSLCAFLCPSFL